MSKRCPIRVLQDPALDGPTNMARDEALLTRVGAGESPPTLRLYTWDPPTISLGYFQKYADVEALEPPAGELAVVRRLTGGGAILHDRELTYSLTLPSRNRLLRRGSNHLYEIVHDALIACLGGLRERAHRDGQTDDSSPTRGPFFCFARRHRFDVLIGSEKLAGSAQRRRQNATLQHGSIVLASRFAQQPTATVSMPGEEAIQRLRSDFVVELATLASEHFEPGTWSNEELRTAEGLVAKYTGTEWTRRR